MKKLVLVLLVLGAALLGGAAWARFFADPPIGPFPGGRLSGTRSAPPESWAMTEGIQHLDVEHLGSALPYSGRYWFVVHEGRPHLILPSLFGPGLHHRLQADPRVRVRVAERLYDQVAQRVATDAVYAAAMPAVMLRQFAVVVEGEASPLPGSPRVETWIWRLDDPVPGAASPPDD